MSISENIKKVRKEIKKTAEDCGRHSNNIHIVAVSKYVDREQISEAIENGLTIFGESRPQQLEERTMWYQGVEVDMVGPLQRNKVKKVIPIATRIHSVDSLRLAEAIEQIAAKNAKIQEIFLQVNASGETQKNGFSLNEIFGVVHKVIRYSHINIIGLMTMAPHHAEENVTMGVFNKVAEIKNQLRKKHPQIKFLSMGMSDDYHLAILAGATHVRIGTAIFTDRRIK